MLIATGWEFCYNDEMKQAWFGFSVMIRVKQTKTRGVFDWSVHISMPLPPFAGEACTEGPFGAVSPWPSAWHWVEIKRRKFFQESFFPVSTAVTAFRWWNIKQKWYITADGTFPFIMDRFTSLLCCFIGKEMSVIAVNSEENPQDTESKVDWAAQAPAFR